MTRGLRRTVASLGILAGLGTLAGFALSQHPSAPPSAAQQEKKIYTNKTKFHLPVKIDDRVRMNLREVCLFVKHNQADWVRHESAGPHQKDFTYNPKDDGEFWFSIVMVDKTGKATPADVNTVPPALKVVVDTKPPVVDLQPWTAPDGENCLRCTVQDANPDFGSLKLMCRGSDQVDRPLVQKANLSGVYKMPAGVVGAVRVSVGDRCGNVTSRDVPLPTATAAVPALKQPVPPVLSSVSKSEAIAPPPPLPMIDPPQTAKAPETQAPMLTEAPKPPVAQPTQQQVLPVEYAAPTPPPAPQVVQPEPKPALQQITPPETKPVVQQVPPPVPQPVVHQIQPEIRPSTPPALLPAAATSEVGNANRLVLNTNQCALEYRIDHVGPSGVGRVEVFITTDQGNTWRRLCEDADRRSPVEMELPGEGLFGVRLVITNGNGFGGTPPTRGETPTNWVEVDCTNPLVQLRDMEPTLGKDGSMEIRWAASDRNLRPDCVNLYFATNRTGPWQNIARGLKNDGLYRWNFPREINAPIFVRVECVDQAGNVARADSAQPLALDTTEPRGTVLGIMPIGVRQASHIQR